MVWHDYLFRKNVVGQSVPAANWDHIVGRISGEVIKINKQEYQSSKGQLKSLKMVANQNGIIIIWSNIFKIWYQKEIYSIYLFCV